MSTPQAIPAGLFHSGNTCPFCQEGVSAGQLIITCPSCGSIHHDSCWAHKNGCSSYHCDTTAQMSNPQRPADIVLTVDEVAKAPLMPERPKRVGTAAAAAMFMPPKPTRYSRMAIIGAVIAALSLIGIVGAFTDKANILALGIGLSFAALVIGVIALLRINNPENRISGVPLAAGSIVAPVVLMLAYFGVLSTHYSHTSNSMKLDFKLQESLPKEANLARMPPVIANATRANVVIRHGDTFSGMSMGSGVVMKMDEHRAYMITNKHVIGDAKSGSIKVMFYTGEESKADIEWTAPDGVDLAILSCQVIGFDKYKQIVIAENILPPGESVFAIGNPMGLFWTYTDGSISGLRTIDGGPHGVELYQTQTPINSGNSGGGLFTRKGELIGINTMTQDKQSAEGLSFAISTETLMKLLSPEQRKKWLGVEIRKEQP